MSIKSVDAKTVKSWLDQNEAVIVDVRESAEYKAAHIDGAHLAPLGSVCSAVLPELHGKKLVLQCKAGGRSLSACKKLLAEDRSRTYYNLEGGIGAWQAAGLPVVKG